MAASNRILSLNIGTQTVGLAEFQTDKQGGLVLSKYRSTSLLSDPAADSSRLSQAGIAVSEMTGEMHSGTTTVNYSVSAQAVFTRFVKLPSVGEEQADQIVSFEAQQNVPFPIDEVVWDYQLVDNGTAEVEVVLVAIKSDLLDEINSMVESSGLLPSVVDVSPMAIYNAYRYNYSDQAGCSLIIDIGARTTNLIFVEPKKVFSRSIPIGGTKITEAIAKDFNEPFGAAEERKKRDGFVSLGGAYADPDDPDIARVSKIIRNSMTRLHAEIARSISFYRAQQHGVAPSRAFLCGGSATLPYMREFFHEKLQLPVEFFNPLRNVAVGPGQDPEELGKQAHTLAEVVGLALRSVSSCPMELNLRPASVAKREQASRQLPFVVLAGVCLLLALGGWWFFLSRAETIATAVAAKVQERMGPLGAMDAKISAVRADIERQKKIAEPLVTLVNDRDYWTRLIDDINSRLPSELIWVVNMAVQEPKTEGAPAVGTPAAAAAALKNRSNSAVLMIRGLYLESPRGALVVDDFVTKLAESPYYDASKEELKRSVPNDSEWAYEFSLPLVLKNYIGRK